MVGIGWPDLALAQETGFEPYEFSQPGRYTIIVFGMTNGGLK